MIGQKASRKACYCPLLIGRNYYSISHKKKSKKTKSHKLAAVEGKGGNGKNG